MLVLTVQPHHLLNNYEISILFSYLKFNLKLFLFFNFFNLKSNYSSLFIYSTVTKRKEKTSITLKKPKTQNHHHHHHHLLPRAWIKSLVVSFEFCYWKNKLFSLWVLVLFSNQILVSSR